LVIPATIAASGLDVDDLGDELRTEMQVAARPTLGVDVPEDALDLLVGQA
jgi:hypothetical protein